jgi:hypothetical protein
MNEKPPRNGAFKSTVLPMVVVMYFVVCTTGRVKTKEVVDLRKLLTYCAGWIKPAKFLAIS